MAAGHKDYSEKPKITPELEEAVMKTLYHHSRTTPIIVEMLTGKKFETAPPLPTNEEKAQVGPIVEELVEHYYRSLRSAYIEVLGEDPQKNWV